MTDRLSSLELGKMCVHLVADKKATQICMLDLRGRHTDYLVICSGTSARHVTNLGQHLVQQLTQRGERPLGLEGETGCSWMLVDYGDVVVHLFDEQTRSHYDIEGLWADAPRIVLPDCCP